MMVSRALRVAGLFVVAAVVALPAAAQGALAVDIRSASFLDDGTTEVVVSVAGPGIDGPVPASAFSVSEAGQVVDGVQVTPIEDVPETDPRTVMVVVDTSGSTEGEPLQNAVAAAESFAREVAASGVAVGLVRFADEATLLAPPSGDPAPVIEALADMTSDGETAFYDAILVAARTLQNVDGERTIVAFSDGADTASAADLTAATTAATTVSAPVSVVALQTSEFDLAAVQRLTEATGGRTVEAAGASELQGAFDEVASTLTNQYVLTYTSAVATGEFELQVSVETAGTTASDAIALISPRDGRAVGQPRVIDVEASPLFGNPAFLAVALGLLFLGLLVVIGFLIVPAGDQRVARTLERGLRVHRRGGGAPFQPGGEAAGRIGRGAVGLVQAVPKPAGYDDRVQRLLDRAAWPLRAAEFTTLRAVAVLLGVLVGWGLFANFALGLVIGAAGWVVPRVALGQRVAARQTKFLAQLPDTLQLLAGSLKAGYGILQGIDTIVKEVPEPTSSEFQRVLTEARLGLPLEDALDSMAERLDSEDFRWVTVAINIQRRVGGNLAELLETVSETLREREMVRRQISVLSAEGRLSAVILTLLPFGLAGYLTIANPDYIGQLFESAVGQLMILAAVALMGVGVVWMRRLIDIDV